MLVQKFLKTVVLGIELYSLVDMSFAMTDALLDYENYDTHDFDECTFEERQIYLEYIIEDIKKEIAENATTYITEKDINHKIAENVTIYSTKEDINNKIAEDTTIYINKNNIGNITTDNTNKTIVDKVTACKTNIETKIPLNVNDVTFFSSADCIYQDHENHYWHEIPISLDFDIKTIWKRLLIIENRIECYTTAHYIDSYQETISDQLTKKFEQTRNIIKKLMTHKIVAEDCETLEKNICYFAHHAIDNTSDIAPLTNYILLYADKLIKEAQNNLK